MVVDLVEGGFPGDEGFGFVSLPFMILLAGRSFLECVRKEGWGGRGDVPGPQNTRR